jgi:alpha-tubulin suppressor-like RCC1 family protein
MRHLLLIDNSIKDLAVFQGCINNNTDSIVFDFATETLATLQTKLSAFGRHRQFQHVGIVQENGPSNKFLKLVENQALVQWIVDKTKCIALDLFICNIIKDPRWKKTIQMIKTSFPQIDLGASNNVTGNNTSDGDWVAETNGANLKTIYLTDDITKYKGTFGMNSSCSIIIDGSGGCYVMGNNYYGQLGLGLEKSFDSISPPEPLTITGKNIIDVQLGDDHSVFLCSDGTVYSCGYNFDGQLGLGNNNNYYTPTQITDISNVSAISCGRDHTLFLCSNGTVYSCGDNNDGQLGLDDYDDRNIPTQITDVSNVLKIAAGSRFSMFLLNNGSIYGTGLNEDGQLGVGDKNDYTVPTPVILSNFSSTVVSISSGRYHTLFLCSDGSVYGAGRNNDGQIGLESTSDYDTPTQIDPTYFSSNVGMIFCGYVNSFFVCMDGNVYGTGDNENGELGIDTISTEATPVQITFFSVNNKTVNYIAAHNQFTIFICSDRNVYGCGDNTNGRVGDGSVELILEPTIYSFSKTITYFTAGQRHSLYLCNDGTVYSCGYGGTGALGLGDNLDVSGLTQITYFTDNSKTVSKIALTKYTETSIFLCSDGTVYGCGDNYFGQLGLGDYNSRNVPTQITDLSNIIDIACAGYSSFFIDNTGNAYSCGYNYSNQLGYSTVDYRSYTPLSIDLSNIERIEAGVYHTLFLLNDGTVYSIGENNYGQLGLGYVNDVSTLTQITDLSNISHISAYRYRTLFLCNDGTVYGVGSNYNGELGLGDTTDRTIITQITDLSNISKISSGDGHSLFLDGSGNVYGCGSNSNAQLGLLKTEDQIINNNSVWTPIQITVGASKVVSNIFTGEYQSAFLCDDNTLYICGENGNQHTFGLKYVEQYTLPTLATFNATIESDLVVCFGEGTEILTIVGDQETYIPVEKLRPGAIVKTYLHGPQVIKKIGTGTLMNNTDDPKKCMFKMEKQGNMTADLCLTGGHAILKPEPPKGLQFKIDDQYLHFVENLPEFKKMEAIHYKYYNFCFENNGDCDLRYGVWANSVLCETPSEKQFDSFNQKMLV